jgi:hypothetical protein
MVIVRSGDASAPEWSAEAPRVPSEPPPSETRREALAETQREASADASAETQREGLASEPAASEPFPLARDLEPSSVRASMTSLDGGWDDAASGDAAVPPAVVHAATTPAEAGPDALRHEPLPEPDRNSMTPPAESGLRRSEAGKAPDESSSREARAVAAYAEPKRPPRTKRWMFVAAAGLALTGYYAIRSPSTPPAGDPQKPEIATQGRTPEAPRSEKASEPAAPGEVAARRTAAASEAPSRPTPPSEPPKDSGKESSKGSTKETSKESAKSARSSKPVPPNATRVRLEVYPSDAKVGRRGVTQKPPYDFDVPKGKRIALEVLKKGYVTRKVTLDGSSTRVVVGLKPAKSTRSR